MAAPPAAVRRELGAAPPRPRAPGQRWRGWRCGGSGRPWRPAALASRCGRPRRGAWPPARWRCPVSGERELAVEAAGLSERLRGVFRAARCPLSRPPGLRSGGAAGVGLPRGSWCGRDVPGAARSLHLLEAGAEGWGSRLPRAWCGAYMVACCWSCCCAPQDGWSPQGLRVCDCKRFLVLLWFLWGTAAALPGFLQHGFLVLLQFLAPQGAGSQPLAGREPGELLAVPQSCSGLVPSWPSWGLCGAGSRPGEGTGRSLMWHTGASKQRQQQKEKGAKKAWAGRTGLQQPRG